MARCAVRALLAEMNAREQLRVLGKERITLSRPRDGWAYIGDKRVSLFKPGQRIVATDAQDGTEKHWRLVRHDLDDGVLIVEAWT